MSPLLPLLLFLTTTSAHEFCQTPNQRPGKCVLINHCPHLFWAVFQNSTSNGTKDHIRQSNCGFESILFPKVCCPIETVKVHESRHAPKCGLHHPDGENDPWIALIEYEKFNGERAYLCGGVLIHKRFILTAAHCVVGKDIPKDARMVNVRFGSYKQASSELPMIVEVDDVIIHEYYSPNDVNQYNDVALVRLKKKVTFKSGAVKPVCLPVSKASGGSLQIAGWEKIENNFTKRSGLVTVWTNAECNDLHNSTILQLRESQICAGGKKKAFLHKNRVDFGRFLMDVNKDSSYSIVGILSRNVTCCDNESSPKVYTKVSHYVNWIFSNLDF